MTEQANNANEIAAIQAHADRVLAAVQAAVRDALIFHKAMGNPISSSVDGRVVWTPADKIVIPDEVVFPDAS